MSESFYSSASVDRFRREHAGHEVVEGKPDGLTVRRRSDPSGVTVRGENDQRVRLLKVLVELVMLPAYPAPIFTITGVKEDLKNAFVQVVPPSQRDEVNEILEKGKYLDVGSRDTVYFWEPRAISFSEDARLAMSLGLSSPVDSRPSEEATQDVPLGGEEPLPSAEAQEASVDSSGGEQSAPAARGGEAKNEAPALLLLPRESETSSLRPAPPSPLPRPEAVTPLEAETGLRSAVEGLSRKAPEPGEGSQTERAEEEKHLLVSRSWYIEGGPRNMREAVRVSRVLRTFRWKVEPTYTIGVMVDDILSVETANGEIGGDMTKQVEGAGYRFSRVSVERGKPVAWFKRYGAPP